MYYKLRGKKWSNTPTATELDITASNAKANLKGVPSGTYIWGSQYGKSEHNLAIVKTTETTITTHEANYEGTCKVRYKEWTWADFASYMPHIYKIVQ